MKSSIHDKTTPSKQSKPPIHDIIYSNIIYFTEEDSYGVSIKNSIQSIDDIQEFDADYFEFSSDISFKCFLKQGKRSGHSLLVLFNFCDPVTHKLDVLRFMFVTVKPKYLVELIQGINKFDFVLSNVKTLDREMVNKRLSTVLSEFGYVMDFDSLSEGI